MASIALLSTCRLDIDDMAWASEPLVDGALASLDRGGGMTLGGIPAANGRERFKSSAQWRN